MEKMRIKLLKMKYKFLEHVGDAKFQAFGKSLNECFKNAALAMFSLITDTKKVKSRITKRIKVRGRDKKALLYNFLEEILYLFDSKGFLLHDLEVRITNNKLEAELIGDKINGYEVSGQIKAVTYNQMEIREKPYRIQVVLDL